MYKKKILMLNFHHIFLLRKLNFTIMGWNKQANSSGYSWLGIFVQNSNQKKDWISKVNFPLQFFFIHFYIYGFTWEKMKEALTHHRLTWINIILHKPVACKREVWGLWNLKTLKKVSFIKHFNFCYFYIT